MDHTIALIQKSHEGDEEARAQIVEENTGLVWCIVRRFTGRGTELEDLFQIGTIGLLKAIDKLPAMNIWSESGQTLGIRPEDIIISDYEKDGVPGIVNEQYYSGDRWIIKVETEKTLMTAFSPSPLQEKNKLWLKLPDDKRHRWEV